MRVLISGAGIAGPTLAYWLARYGAHPTLVEKAPGLRSGGYIIDFWGAGLDVAGRMGLLPTIRRKAYVVREVRAVDTNGSRLASVPAASFTGATAGGIISLPRGDLAASIFESLPSSVDTIFGDSVRSIQQRDSDVYVTFEQHEPGAFDLVVGADGLHSHIRELVFGPERRFERYLGMKVAAFEIEGYRPRDELVYVMYSQVGQQISRFAMKNDRTMFLFTFADDDSSVPRDMCDSKALLRKRFAGRGWESSRILDALDAAPDLYFDRVSQVHMDPTDGLWTNNRVTLLGDAASCVSLLGGQGSALAMAGAYILAGELHQARGGYKEAFENYQRLFGPFICKKQRAARRFAGAFAPRSRLALFVRDRLFQLMSIRWVASVVAGRGFRDKIVLPEY